MRGFRRDHADARPENTGRPNHTAEPDTAGRERTGAICDANNSICGAGCVAARAAGVDRNRAAGHIVYRDLSIDDVALCDNSSDRARAAAVGAPSIGHCRDAAGRAAPRSSRARGRDADERGSAGAETEASKGQTKTGNAQGPCR